MNNKLFKAIVYSTLYIAQLYSNPIPETSLESYAPELYVNATRKIYAHTPGNPIRFIYSGTDTEAQEILQSHMNMITLGNQNYHNSAITPKNTDSKFRKYKYSSAYEHSLYRRYCNAYKARLDKEFARARTAKSPHDALQHARNYQLDLQANIKLILDVQKALMERKNDFPAQKVSLLQATSKRTMHNLLTKEKKIQNFITQNQQILQSKSPATKSSPNMSVQDGALLNNLSDLNFSNYSAAQALLMLHNPTAPKI